MKVVIKIGGSVLKLDEAGLKEISNKIKNWSEEHEIAIVVGAGKLSREYGALGRKLTKDENLLDRIGIFVARLNASVVISALGDSACPEIPRSEEEFLALNEKYPGKIIVSGGFRPKQRTDAVAAEIASVFGADLIIKCTNVDYVFDKDPNKFEDAKPITEISFDELEKLVNVGEYRANAPTIMDRTAAGLLIKNKIRVTIVGPDWDNVQKVLASEEFKGTKVGF